MNGTLQYYNIYKLGIYKKGSDQELFESSELIINSLIDWFNSRPNLVNTSTKVAEKTTGQINVYCYDITGQNGEYVIILWNELTNAENEILTVRKDSKPGKAKVKSGVNSKDDIPGLPSYYWISLNNGFVATIAFDHAITSLAALKNYITSYVQSYSEFAITHEEDDNKVIGYRHPENDGELGYFKFELKRKIDELTIEELTEKYDRITKIVRRIKKSAVNTELKGFFHNLASNAINRGIPDNKDANVEIELDFTPATQQDFLNIVDAYKKQITDPERYNNLGFVIKGENGKKIFLDGKHLRTEHGFEIVRNKKNPFGASELLNYIEAKHRILIPRKQKKRRAA
ncbi:hypothetical protein [Aeromonas dhakensis]|uniref:hypothetical protein n=1 Tax=Aeromonas dhakensis TaxID=196024 RepID=UPI0018A6DCBB|nr:hypothetical protein [Aeromonas dhakensis]MBF8449489.1 hypothetical protein [Aeromonas dhakensis]